MKLYRSREGRIAGVCAGFGNYWALDPAWLRLLLVFVCLVTVIVPFVVLYIACWLLMPLEPSGYPHSSVRQLRRSYQDSKISGLCGGIAAFLERDSTVIRVLVVFIGIFTCVLPLVIAYFVGWLMIPKESA